MCTHLLVVLNPLSDVVALARPSLRLPMNQLLVDRMVLVTSRR